MSGFPLYDNLIQGLPKKDLAVKEKEKFIRNINDIDMNGKELVYVLILVFSQQEKSKITTDIPYKGMCERDQGLESHTFSWIFTHFPIKLRRLLYRFVDIHMKKQKEEASRKDQRL